MRLFGLDKLKPVARLAELLTLAALANAGLYIVLHVGRPDRIATSILPNLGQTIRSSPLAWDVVVITLYFVLTGTYLALTIRHDVYRLRDRLPRAFAPLYWVLLTGYRPDERRKADRMAWWLALGVIVLAPLFLHGGVIPWLFALLPGQPVWFGPVQGPLFLAAAPASRGDLARRSSRCHCARHAAPLGLRAPQCAATTVAGSTGRLSRPRRKYDGEYRS